ncbi:Myb-like, SWIRM and MPN domains 1, partial [Coemansia sp. RSA 371]
MDSGSKEDSEQIPALGPVPATNGRLAVNGELVAEPVAVNGELQPAFTVDPATTSEAEQRGCREFFLGKANKTAERYMRIRNHMIAEWETTKPTYLTKIRARAGLKNCGDVNAIGRVHTFLENARIINAGAVQARRRPAV